MKTKNNALIGEVLVERKIITSEQLESALAQQKKAGGSICSILVKSGFASEDQVLGVLSEQLEVPYVKLKDALIDSAAIQKIPPKLASHYKIMPLGFKDGRIVIAMADPLNVRTLDEIKLILSLEVSAVLASEAQIQEAIRKYYGVGAETLERMVAAKFSEEDFKADRTKTQDLEAMADDTSIVKFVNQILTEAINNRATDIHLEPFQEELRTRFRIDGVLYNINIPDTIKYFHPAIVSRIKIMAHMNIAERRLPQDGRIKIRLNNRELDMRISTLPTAFGEAVHLRILSPQFFLELEKLGLSEEDLRILEKVIKKPHGIVFVTGPTGSGKTTTLYASLAKINSEAVKIITIEDPIEYQLNGVNQIQVMPQIQFTFATALRHMLRHDPDVMMVGEVRDHETAEIAIRSALTGHLVFSTLHTNDAAGAVTRLLDMDIEPFLVSSSLECMIAQRLVRLICPKCKTELSAEHKNEIVRQIKNVNFKPEGLRLYEGKGCQFCRFTGYHGRTAVYEILVMNEPIRKMILERASSQQIKQKAISQGMRTLWDDGARKVASGLTTLTEVIRVTQQEEPV
jgi:type II secretion system protein E